MKQNDEWGAWELRGVIVRRRSMADRSKCEAEYIKHPIAMPNCKQHCCRVWNGDKVYVSIMGNTIECVGEREAKAIMDLFSLQYGLGAVSGDIGRVVHGHEKTSDSSTP